MTQPDVELFTKVIQERHLYMRQLYDARVQWARTLFLANVAAVAWVTATANNQPPGWAFLHVVILMNFFNGVGIVSTIFARRQFAALDSTLQSELTTLFPEPNTVLASLAKAFPKGAYNASFILISVAIGICSLSWILVYFEKLRWPS